MEDLVIRLDTEKTKEVVHDICEVFKKHKLNELCAFGVIAIMYDNMTDVLKLRVESFRVKQETFN